MPDLLVNGCVVTRATHWWFSPCYLRRASPQVWLQRSRVGPGNLHCDFYGSGKDRVHWPTPQQGLQGLLQCSPPFCPSLASPHSTGITGHALHTSQPLPMLFPLLSIPLPPTLPMPSSSTAPSRLARGSLLHEACLTVP